MSRAFSIIRSPDAGLPAAESVTGRVSPASPPAMKTLRGRDPVIWPVVLFLTDIPQLNHYRLMPVGFLLEWRLFSSLLQPIWAMIKPFGFAVLWIWHPGEVSALSGWFDAAFSLINSGWNKPAEPLFFRFCR